MLANLCLQRPLAVLDLETTGINVRTDRVVEIGVLKLRPDGSSAQYTQRFNPEVPIPAEASAVHGIFDADVAGAPRFADEADKLRAGLDGCDLCGFNINRFDLPLLYNEFRRAGRSFDLEGRAVIDPLEIFRAYQRRDLSAAVRHYLGREHTHGHSASADVLATAAVLDAMLARHADLPREPADLHARFGKPNAVDSAGFFARVQDEIRFVKGKHRGQPLARVALTSPDYLEWMLRQDFFDDTKAIVRRALLGSEVST
jgi:DNA polymerase III subunit epsilon